MQASQCGECGNPVGPKDEHCPSCGKPLKGRSGDAVGSVRDHITILGILVVVALVYIGYQAFSKPPGDESAHNHRPADRYAAPDMARFVENLPTEFGSLVSMGNALMDQMHFSMAIECYNRALEQKPENVAVRVDLGVCQYSVGEYDKAIANFKKALEYDPAHHIAKFNMGIVYAAAGDTASAVEWWEKLLAENPPEELKLRVQSSLRELQ